MTSFRQNFPPLNSSIKRKKVFGKLVLVGEEGKRKLCHYCGDIMWEAATTRIHWVDPGCGCVGRAPYHLVRSSTTVPNSLLLLLLSFFLT